MREKTCFFTGHRSIPRDKENRIKEELSLLITKQIEKGYTTFVSGGAIGFDIIAAEAVLKLKERYPFLRLVIIIPCKDQPCKWSLAQKERYYSVLSLADECECLSPIYFDGCMQIRNRRMADMSSLCIAYLTKSAGGSASTVNYAEKQGIPVINIAADL